MIEEGACGGKAHTNSFGRVFSVSSSELMVRRMKCNDDIPVTKIREPRDGATGEV